MATFFFTELSQNLLSDKARAIQYDNDAIQRMSYRREESGGEPRRKFANPPAEAIVSLSLAYKLPQPTLASDELLHKKSLCSAQP